MNGYFDHRDIVISILDKRPKMVQKSAEMPIFLPADPKGPKDSDLDPGAKIDWSNPIFDPAHST